MEAEVQAWTRVDADGVFRFDVISQTGSTLIREHVLLKALETERRTHNERENARIELRPENYQFEAKPGAGRLAIIGLRPRRQGPMLLDGVITVKREDGDIVRLDGSPSESPSWCAPGGNRTALRPDQRRARAGGVVVAGRGASRRRFNVSDDVRLRDDQRPACPDATSMIRRDSA